MKRIAGIVLAATLLTITEARAVDNSVDIARGRELAETWCASCHAVLPTARTQSLAAGSPPDFSAVANAPTGTKVGLSAFLQSPHARMPDFSLSREQISILADYILSLRAK